MTVAKLIKQLQSYPQDAIVETWLPGTYISLHGVSHIRKAHQRKGKVLIEGSVNHE